jgi:hypothetical protein
VIFFKLIVKVLRLPAVGDFEKQMYHVTNKLNVKNEPLKTTETTMDDTIYYPFRFYLIIDNIWNYEDEKLHSNSKRL